MGTKNVRTKWYMTENGAVVNDTDNGSWTSRKTWPSAILSTTNPTGVNVGHDEKTEMNSLCYAMVQQKHTLALTKLKHNQTV